MRRRVNQTPTTTCIPTGKPIPWWACRAIRSCSNFLDQLLDPKVVVSVERVTRESAAPKNSVPSSANIEFGDSLGNSMLQSSPLNFRRAVMWIARLILGPIFIYAGYSKAFLPNSHIWPWFFFNLSFRPILPTLRYRWRHSSCCPPGGVQFVAHTLPFTEIVLGLLVSDRLAAAHIRARCWRRSWWAFSFVVTARATCAHGYQLRMFCHAAADRFEESFGRFWHGAACGVDGRVRIIEARRQHPWSAPCRWLRNRRPSARRFPTSYLPVDRTARDMFPGRICVEALQDGRACAGREPAKCITRSSEVKLELRLSWLPACIISSVNDGNLGRGAVSQPCETCALKLAVHVKFAPDYVCGCADGS